MEVLTNLNVVIILQHKHVSTITLNTSNILYQLYLNKAREKIYMIENDRNNTEERQMARLSEDM